MVVALSFGGIWCAQAQPTIVSVSPTNGATGVSPTTQVVFTFSTAMNTGMTFGEFLDADAGTNIPAFPAWSSGNTVVTYTPFPSFPTNRSAILNQFTADAGQRPVIAGPVEATAMGNLLVQARASGELSSLAEMRQVVRKSSEVTTCQPGKAEPWEAAYDRFAKLVC